FEKRNEAFFKDAPRVNRAVKLLTVNVGDKDFALAGSKQLAELLKKNGIKHELHVSGGGHTWINWRHYLNALAPRLFRDEPAPGPGRPTAGLPTARPAEVGGQSERLRRVGEVVRRHIAAPRLPGAV